MTKIQQIQQLLGTTPDDKWGPKSQAALAAHAYSRSVLASSFADPADIQAFQACKARGGSDEECFLIGDNGIGKWGDDTTQGSGPACALPPEDWNFLAAPPKTKVLVTHQGNSVICELRDTMPAKVHITNGADIDLNPDACTFLELTPPVLTQVTWKLI